MARLLVVSAWPPEIAPLVDALAGRRRRGIACEAVGVGLVDAALGAARLIARLRPDDVVFVGTAGIYGARSARVADVRVARRICLVSSAAGQAQSYLPAPMSARISATPALARAIARAGGLARADVACPVAITKSAALARALTRRTGAALENLEAFAVGRAALAAGARFAAVLGVANVVGPRGHEEWRSNHDAASRAACAALAAWLDAR